MSLETSELDLGQRQLEGPAHARLGNAIEGVRPEAIVPRAGLLRPGPAAGVP